jgi:hypothetical protein
VRVDFVVGAVHDRNHHAAGAGAGAGNGNGKDLDGAAAGARDGIANLERVPALLCHRPPRNQRTTSEPERRPFCST